MFFLFIDTRTTQWEDPRMWNPQIAGPAIPYSRDYKRKYEFMKTQLRKPVWKLSKEIVFVAHFLFCF